VTRVLPNDVTGVAMFHIGRCGSTVIADMLGRQPNFRSIGEIYTAYRGNRLDQQSATPGNYTAAKLAQASAAIKNRGTVLFEVKFLPTLDMTFFPGGMECFLETIGGMGVTKAIVLSRRNLLRRLVSTAISVKRKAYQKRAGETVNIPTVSLPLSGTYLGATGTIVQIFDMIDREYDALRDVLDRHGMAALALEYEADIQDNPGLAVTKTCHFLGLEPVDVSPEFQRINNKGLADILSNYAAVSEILNGTKFEGMLT